MESLVVLALLWVLWLISPRHWQHRVIIPAAVLALAHFILTSSPVIALAAHGLTAALPPDSGDSVSSIVVLGRGNDLRPNRIEVAEQLWHSKRSPMIFASGMSDADSILGELKSDGIPDQALRGERCSQSTAENAVFTSAILHPLGMQKILLVTDPFHMRRAILSFRSLGFTVIPHASPLPSQISTTRQVLLLLREYVGLAQYALTGKFKPHSAFELDHPAVDVTEKLIVWNCSLSP